MENSQCISKIKHRRARAQFRLIPQCHFNLFFRLCSLQNLTLVFPKPINFSKPKFAQMITSSISHDVQNLVKIRFPTNRWNITLAWRFCAFPSLPFPFFLAVLYRKNGWTDFNARWLIWRGFVQGSAFWGTQNLNSTFLPIFSQKYEKLQWRLWGKIRQCFKLS